jgi:hypothetical protein
MTITFSSAFYIFKAKFDVSVYVEWMNHFLSIVNDFNLVIYTDTHSQQYIQNTNNPRIKIIIKPLEEFYQYKYKDFWIANHEQNVLLKDKVDWRVNALWSEKIWFVLDTINNKYFETDLYGWCDIGYFRNRDNDTSIQLLKQWPKEEKLQKLNPNKIHYACVNNDNSFMNLLYKNINKKNILGLPMIPTPRDQTSIAGGFFIGKKERIIWWSKIYDEKLSLYFKYNSLVKDDQIIIIDCIMSDLNNFGLHKEIGLHFDNWFMFQRILN